MTMIQNVQQKTHTHTCCYMWLRIAIFSILFFVFIVFWFPLDIEREPQRNWNGNLNKIEVKEISRRKSPYSRGKEMINWMRTSNKSHHNTTFNHSHTHSPACSYKTKRYRRLLVCATVQRIPHVKCENIQLFAIFFPFSLCCTCVSYCHFETWLRLGRIFTFRFYW